MKKLSENKLLYLVAATIVTFTTTSTLFATPPVTKYMRGETLDPSCAPGDPNCTVDTDETDPTVKTFAKTTLPTCSIGQVLKGNWTSLSCVADSTGSGGISSESDPIFSLSQAFSITSTMLANWNAAFGWGDHHSAGYLTGETDPSVNTLAKASLSCSANQIPQYNGTTWACATQGAGADNLGNHTATQNIKLSGNYLSNDGDNEGVFVSTGGLVGIGTTNPFDALNIIVNSNSSRGQIVENSNAGSAAYARALLKNDIWTYAWMILNSSANSGFSWVNSLKIWNFWNWALGLYTSNLERIKVDSTGNVGIGTTTPSEKLDVSGNIKLDRGAGYKPYTLATDSNWIFFRDDTNSRYPFKIDAGAYDNALVISSGGNVGIGTSSPTARLHVASGPILIDNSQFFKIKDSGGLADEVLGAWSDDYTKILSIKNWIDFQSDAGTTMMRIEDNWSVWIWTTTPAYSLHVSGSKNNNWIAQVINSGTSSAHGFAAQTTAADSVAIAGVNQATGSYGYLWYGAYGVYCFGSYCGGTQAWNSASDARLKTNVRDIAAADGLDAILKLRPVRFNWRDAVIDARSGTQLGFIAQEVEKVLPEVVEHVGTATIVKHRDGWQQVIEDTLSMSYATVVVPLVKAVQELKAENDRLRYDFEAYRVDHP